MQRTDVEMKDVSGCTSTDAVMKEADQTEIGVERKNRSFLRVDRQNGKRHYIQLVIDDVVTLMQLNSHRTMWLLRYLEKKQWRKEEADLFVASLAQPTPHITVLFGIVPERFDEIANYIDAELARLQICHVPLQPEHKIHLPETKRDREFVCVDVDLPVLNQLRKDWTARFNAKVDDPFVPAHITLYEFPKSKPKLTFAPIL